jgi:5'-nucleotidase
LLKNQDTDGLLFDAGDFLNGGHSPAQQKEVIYTMNNMGYIAATIGNHELSGGQDALAALIPSMQFSMVNCNYQFNDALSRLIKPYTIINSGKFKIGVTGVGHELNGIKYNDAIQCANHTASILKEKEKCDLVIVLSHLGYSQKGGLPDNLTLAQSSENIDLIISGHNQRLLAGPVIKLNRLKREVIISQAAWDGLMVGKVVFNFENGKQRNGVKAKNFITGQPCEETGGASFAKLRLLEKRLISA